jgi:hypothetical protein
LPWSYSLCHRYSQQQHVQEKWWPCGSSAPQVQFLRDSRGWYYLTSLLLLGLYMNTFFTWKFSEMGWNGLHSKKLSIYHKFIWYITTSIQLISLLTSPWPSLLAGFKSVAVLKLRNLGFASKMIWEFWLISSTIGANAIERTIMGHVVILVQALSFRFHLKPGHHQNDLVLSRWLV